MTNMDTTKRHHTILEIWDIAEELLRGSVVNTHLYNECVDAAQLHGLTSFEREILFEMCGV